MVKVTAAEVNKLRKTTGAGMMDCKKALVEAEGNFDEAIDILRKKGQKVAAKRADRESTEGAAIAKVNDSKMSLVDRGKLSIARLERKLSHRIPSVSKVSTVEEENDY